jgi:pYEATS domain-containing protein involved in immunity/TIR domain-containing protein
MTYKILQDYEYTGNDYWNWHAWIDGTPDELAKVERVEWLLHPSFTPSVVESTNRASKFRLKTSGWGTFLLRAQVQGINGSIVTLRHQLELRYPDDAKPPMRGVTSRSGPPRAKPRPEVLGASSEPRFPRKIFLSYGAEDRGEVLKLRQTLESLGLQVFDDRNIGAGESWEVALRNLQAASDATIAYVPSDIPSPFVARDVKASMQSGKPTLVITNQDTRPIAGLDSAVPVARTSLDDPRAVSRALEMFTLPSSDSV